ncbi:hypothetical protein [Bacillus massiliigorillae]|nr:hypothetical protein [Bacillus massiliigorillae]
MKEKQHDLDWIDSILENCENLGISKQIIHRFVQYYLSESEDLNE